MYTTPELHPTFAVNDQHLFIHFFNTDAGKPAGTALDVSSVTFSSVDLLKESALTQRDKEVCLAVTRFSLGPLPHEPAARGPCWPLAAA
jgi:hypothetical protein